MTTAVYSVKEGLIAVDSRLCRGSTIVSDDCDKIITSDNGVFVLSGDHQATIDLSNSYPSAPECQSNCSGFVIVDGFVYWASLFEGSLQVSECGFNESTGSGQDHALTTLDLGFGVVDAIKSASKRDNCTGGNIRVLNVKSLEVEVIEV